MAPSSLKVIALISGGKDSLFSILHCLAHGHEIVALANLYPSIQLSSSRTAETCAAEADFDDINSYMYQTAGHTLVPLYSQALGLPVYREPILGSAINTDKIYYHRTSSSQSFLATRNLDQSPHTFTGKELAEALQDDETESLVPLLRKIMSLHPTATALSTGAILSTYQRTRTESVALRLNLVPLSYLWQYPSLPPYTQTALLDDIGAVGQDSRIIKVASGGLDEEFLWEDVASEQTKKRLVKSMGRFGGEGAVLGEGGEFETITIDGPSPLWKGRIEVPQIGREVAVDSGATAGLRISGAKVVAKNNEGKSGQGALHLRIPDLLDTEFKKLTSAVKDQQPPRGNLYHVAENTEPVSIIPSAQIVTIGNLCIISNIISPKPAKTAELQITGILELLSRSLRDFNRTPQHIAFTTILLRSMSSFSSVNAVYGSLFTAPNPPARVTIACGHSLPEGVEVMMSVEIDLGPRRLIKGLHVQSRSYWAPANIGPYSQAIAVPLRTDAGDEGDVNTGHDEPKMPEIVYVAGQIPLVPAVMELWNGQLQDGLEQMPAGLEENLDKTRQAQIGTLDRSIGNEGHPFKKQAILALQHLWRIGRAMGINFLTGAVAFIVGSSADQVRGQAMMAAMSWKGIHELVYAAINAEEDSDNDVMDVWDLKHGLGAASNASSKTPEDGRRPLPDFSKVTSECFSPAAQAPIPPFFAVEVAELPRGASVEWASTGIANGSVRLQELRTQDGIQVSICAVQETGMRYLWAGIHSVSQITTLRSSIEEYLRKEGEPSSQQAAHYTVYTSLESGLSSEWLKETRAQVVPCKSVWDAAGNELVAGIVVRLMAGAGVIAQHV